MNYGTICRLTVACVVFMTLQNLSALSQEARDKGFVYLHEIDPTIRVSLRYYGDENFVGRPIVGYKKSVVVILRAAAEALKKVQQEVQKDGYSLVVYDAYRPQKAVDDFVAWGERVQDCCKKRSYYPRLDKARVFELDYIAKRSGHTRGSTVDLTIINIDEQLHDVVVSERVLKDGTVIRYLDDGTVDMGSSFDMFDEVSHTKTNLVAAEFAKMRSYLKNVMGKYGFKNYPDEWWHFTYYRNKHEQYPADSDSSYFNFDIA